MYANYSFTEITSSKPTEMVSNIRRYKSIRLTQIHIFSIWSIYIVDYNLTRSEKLSQKCNKTQKGDPLDFLTIPSTPSEEFGKNPKPPPPPWFPITMHLCLFQVLLNGFVQTLNVSVSILNKMIYCQKVFCSIEFAPFEIARKFVSNF